jgi:23S rRNA pseudouridine2605 synthase
MPSFTGIWDQSSTTIIGAFYFYWAWGSGCGGDHHKKRTFDFTIGSKSTFCWGYWASVSCTNKATAVPQSSNSKPSNLKGTRLNKYLSNAGICSRREADQYIAMGLVSVNGKVVTEMGHQVQFGDKVRYDDQPVNSSPPVYLLMNKPKGFVATKQGGNIKKSVQELVRTAHPEKIPPVGDMGRTVTGLLLMTNNEKLRQKMADPKSRFPTLYQVILEKNAEIADLDALTKGIRIMDKVHKVKSAAYIQGGTKKEIGIEASNLSPGLLKKILEKRDLTAVSMDRVLLAGLTKKDLPRGRWRPLSQKEIQFLNMIS